MGRTVCQARLCALYRTDGCPRTRALLLEKISLFWRAADAMVTPDRARSFDAARCQGIAVARKACLRVFAVPCE